MRAILSDIHGNLEAITAVLYELSRRDVTKIYNLGDILGYGPNPLECLDLSRQMDVVLKGNFDFAVQTSPDGFCHAAEKSILWTQVQLQSEPNIDLQRERTALLIGLPHIHREDGIKFVHGSPRNPLNEYLFPEDIYNDEKMTRLLPLLGSLCFVGHTHVPGIFRALPRGKWEFIQPEECQHGFPIAGEKLICNVGSVGQPRDEDERACYVLFDGNRIWFHRIAYDVQTTRRKIYAIPELENFLGDRLLKGR